MCDLCIYSLIPQFPFLFPLVYHSLYHLKKFVTQQSCGELYPERLNYKQYEQLEKDIVQLAEIEPIKDIKISVTGNSVIDAFVNYKYGIARKNKINFKPLHRYII